MNWIQQVRGMIRSYPRLSAAGHAVLKQFWRMEAGFKNYDYPKSPTGHTLPLPEIVAYNKSRPFGPRRRFCYAPFNNINFQINGDVTLCSFNEKLKIGNVKDASLLELWHGEQANYFRSKMMDYDLTKCKTCRLAFGFQNYNSLPPSKYDVYATENSDFPTQISFEISDTCNLECVMCTEDLSSSIRKRKGLAEKPFAYNDDFVAQLSPFIPNLSIATFIGGEPFLIRFYNEIWQEILKFNKQCKIHIQTNGTILTKKFLQLLESKQFEIGISVDAISKNVYESIRLNADYNKVFENIEILTSYAKKGWVELNINFCMMTNNWQELPKMVVFCNERDISLKVIHVEGPFHLDVKNLSSSELYKLINELESRQFPGNSNWVAKRNLEIYQGVIRTIKGYLNYVQQMETAFERWKLTDLATMQSMVKEALYHHEIFNKVDLNSKEEMWGATQKFVGGLPISFQQKVLLRFYLFLTGNPHDVEDSIDFVKLDRFLQGFYEHEKNLVQAELQSQ